MQISWNNIQYEIQINNQSHNALVRNNRHCRNPILLPISILSPWRQICDDFPIDVASLLVVLTHRRPVTPYGNIDLGQHWFR